MKFSNYNFIFMSKIKIIDNIKVNYFFEKKNDGLYIGSHINDKFSSNSNFLDGVIGPVGILALIKFVLLRFFTVLFFGECDDGIKYVSTLLSGNIGG